jgi:endoglucanase
MADLTLSVFKTLTSVPTAPYREKAVTARALAWIAQNLGRRVRVAKKRGGVVVRYVGAGDAPALALAAHLDHPAFSREGKLWRLRGGLPPHLLPGTAVEAHPAVPRGNAPLAYGRVVAEKKPGLWELRFDSPPKAADFALLALKPCEVSGGWVRSRSIDDLMGCAMSLEALRRVAAAGLKVNLTVLLHRAEEVGFMGALDLIAEGAVSKDDSVISVETSREMPGARPGQGPVIRLGDKATLFDANLTAVLDEAARGMKAQRLRLTGGTCEATAYLAYGYEAGGLAIPLVNYHNGWGAKKIAEERVRLSDVRGAVTLLERAAKVFAKTPSRGVLRRRLTARHAANKKYF